jgi:thioredoxin reductase (NADPH)
VRVAPGQFIGDIAQLSGGFALVDANADEDVEVLLIQPDRIRALIVAGAELGERVVRALMLRRVVQIETGRSRAVLIGEFQSPHMLRLENFLRRAATARVRIDYNHRALVERCSAADLAAVVTLPNSAA